ncbi:hypothetical protein [Streptomyces sp. CAU 1734]|uniref:hypothetical protein n=1 Tax=Streptomyces sp. CAU 1734 TaxID=3140360 RepID=UPI0032613BFB
MTTPSPGPDNPASGPAGGGGIEVRRCTVTVVRRGGWSWGPDPRALAQRAVEALPGLLEHWFAGRLAAGGPDVEITEPVTVTVRLPPPGHPAHHTGDILPAEAGPPWEARVAPPPDGTAPGAPADPFPHSLTAPGDRGWSPPPAAALFAELAERGELEPLLALLPDHSVRACLLALLRTGDPLARTLLAELLRRHPGPAPHTPDRSGPPPPGSPAAGPGTPAGPAALERLLAELLAAHGAPAVSPHPAGNTGPARTVRPPGGSAAEPSGAGRPLAGPTAAGRAADPAGLTAPLSAPASGTVSEPGDPAGQQQQQPPGGTAPPGPAGHGHPRIPERGAQPPPTAVPRATGERTVRSALPFLLAGPLARIGYLDAIGPALAGVDLAADAPLFATALAYKVLGATGRGWRREHGDSEAAAVFAGLEPPVPEERLTSFARLARPVLPVLDAVLALAVCRGHDPADPLLVTGAGGGVLLVDAQGMFPVARTEGTAGLLPHWRTSGRPPVLVCDGPLPPGFLRELASEGVRFVSAVRPLRGDPALRLPGRTPLWTAAPAPGDRRLAAALPGHAADLAELVRALTAERRAVPRAPDTALEDTVTLAAALGLATIAWTLWRGRETTGPLLALNRFADLEAAVRFGPDTVRVRVPLGRRHADLLRAGLLADVPDVVWLGGRTLTFSGG